MSEWTTEKIGNLIHTITKGTTPNKTMGGFSESGVNYIKSESISYEGRIDSSKFAFISELTHQQLKRSQLQKDDILFSMAGAYLGKSAIVTEDLLPANTNQALAIIRLNQAKANPRFVNYFFRHPNVIDYVNNLSGQSAQPNINFEEIKSIEIDLPSLSEQKAIASVLSSLDDKIDLLHRQNKTLEAMAETLFRQWFIEEAKEDWEELLVGDIAIHIKDNVNPSKDPLKTFYHFSLPAFDSGQKPTMEVGSDILSNKYRVAENSILVSKLNPRVPRIWLLANVEENYVCSTEFQNLKPKVKSHLMFLYRLFSSRDVVEELTMSASGTSGSHQRVKPEDMLNITFRTPSLNYLDEYSLLITPSMQKVAFNKQQIQTLEKLRDTLLPKLMSGEIRVQY